MAEMMQENSNRVDSTTIGVYRTSATVKGGRRFSFGALVVVGDRNGRVGYGYAKANEVPNAIENANKAGERQMVPVTRVGTTIHHEVEGRFAAAKIRLIPAAPGTGVVAGGVVRAVLEKAGITDCLSKCYGSTNPVNVLKAVFDGLAKLRTPEQVAGIRGVMLERTMILDKIEKGKAFMPATRAGEKARGPVNNMGSDRPGRGGGGGRRRRESGGDGGGGGGASASAAGTGGAPAEGAVKS